ncbi:H/ACA ribonucleoprotein complex non-core subunit NAF1 [Salmo salar]|uniref:H/ACA ribonucleoprotein complex non-core subunit NAF1 n=1 Tax=Salmo salar TaxID=8030 RepID=A0ABM3E9B2_SALSA|nr:H/ACA ribonucleoprotein complex non-core subunit NAF1-like [Salmo salar]
MEVQPEETVVVPEVLQSSAETHGEELELNDGPPLDPPQDVSQDPSQDPPQDPPQDPSQDLLHDPLPGPPRTPPRTTPRTSPWTPPGRLPGPPQDHPQDLLQDPPQDLPQVLLTLQDGVRDQRDGSSSSSDSDSDSSSSGVTLAVVLGQADDEDDDDEGFSRTRKPCSIKTLDETLPEELPAVEELTVVLPEEAEILPLGSVTSIIQQLVIIQSFKDTPPLKDDSVIFNSDRLAVGKVFEVFGPVSSPFYVLRFNSESDVTERGVKLKDSMFYAPSLTDYTLYILTEQLRRLKGSDASWKNDQEPPPEALDFSDDEAEQKMKRRKKGNVQKSERERGQRADPQPDRDSVTRPQMSQRPLQQSRPPRRDNWGPPPRYEGAPFYPHQPHYPYPPPYQPQSFPLYPPLLPPHVLPLVSSPLSPLPQPPLLSPPPPPPPPTGPYPPQ